MPLSKGHISLNSAVGASAGGGSQGLKGDKGDTGDVGPQGPSGLQGIQGEQGIPGPSGATGPQGIQGIQGISGLIGAQGIQGIQGEIGPQGIQGMTGSGGPTILITSVDLPWNSTNLRDVSGVGILINPQERIVGEACIFFTVATAATGMALALNGPTAPSAVIGSILIPTTATAMQNGSFVAYETKVIGTAGLTTINAIRMNFTVINGSNSGILIPRMCSEGATVVTIKKGSYVKYFKV